MITVVIKITYIQDHYEILKVLDDPPGNRGPTWYHASMFTTAMRTIDFHYIPMGHAKYAI